MTYLVFMYNPLDYLKKYKYLKKEGNYADI